MLEQSSLAIICVSKLYHHNCRDEAEVKKNDNNYSNKSNYNREKKHKKKNVTIIIFHEIYLLV